MTCATQYMLCISLIGVQKLLDFVLGRHSLRRDTWR